MQWERCSLFFENTEKQQDLVHEFGCMHNEGPDPNGTKLRCFCMAFTSVWNDTHFMPGCG